MKLYKDIVLLTVFVFTILFIGCQADEIKFPPEYLKYPVNFTQNSEPLGFLNWGWGTTPDSATWTDHKSNRSLAAHGLQNPQWVIRRKSGLEKYSLNLLPQEYSTAYGVEFNSVHLIFHPGKGLTGWDRIIYKHNTNSGEAYMDSLYSTLLDTLSTIFGSPHQLPPSTSEASVELTKVSLWRGESTILTLSQYNYINQQSKIYLKARLQSQ